jgi:hypothetical protein
MDFTFISGVIILAFGIFSVFLFGHKAALLLNLIIIIILLFRIKRDTRHKSKQKYYLFSLLLTAIFFISSAAAPIKNFIAFTEKMLLTNITLAIILVYAFAYLLILIRIIFRYLREKYKKWKSD